MGADRGQLDRPAELGVLFPPAPGDEVRVVRELADDKALFFDEAVTPRQLPNAANYMALGHIHKPRVPRHGVEYARSQLLGFQV